MIISFSRRGERGTANATPGVMVNAGPGSPDLLLPMGMAPM